MTQPPPVDVLDPTDGDRPASDPAAPHGAGRSDADPTFDPTYHEETAPETDGDSNTDPETATGSGRKPTKAEVDSAASLVVDNTRRARRRRRRVGYAMVGLIIMSAAASVVGWPVVLAAGAAAGGGVAASGVARTRRDPARQASRAARQAVRTARRNQRQTRTTGGRTRRAGSTGGLSSGLRRRATGGAAARTGARSGGTAGRRATGRAAGLGTGRGRVSTGGAGRRATGTGARSGGTTGRRRTSGTGMSWPFGGRRTGAGAGRRSNAGRSTHPRTARQAKREAIRQARIGRTRTAADRGARIREARRARRWARTDRRRNTRWDRRQQRRGARAEWRQRRRQARWERRDARRAHRWETADVRQERRRAWRRRIVKRYVRRPIRRTWRRMSWRHLTRWAAGRARVMAFLDQANPAPARPGLWQRTKAKMSAASVLAMLGAVMSRMLGRRFARFNRQPVAATTAAESSVVAEAEALAAAYSPPPPPPAHTDDDRAAMAVEAESWAEATEHKPRRRPRPRATVKPPVRPAYLTRPFQTTGVPAGPRPRQIIAPPKGQKIMSNAGSDAAMHPAFEAVADALENHVGAWEIPGGGEGVADTDLFIASIGPFLTKFSEVLGNRAEYFGGGDTPVAPVVGDTLADFGLGIQAMAEDAADVYESWSTNEDNAHDLARANGEVPNAELFNV